MHLCMVDVDSLTETEQRLIDAVKIGCRCDFADGQQIRTGDMALWGPERTIRAAVLKSLLTEDRSRWDLGPDAAVVSVRGAVVSGDLAAVDAVQLSLQLDWCRFDGDVSFDRAIFDGSASFTDTMFTGRASFAGATFRGDASFAGATFIRDRFDDATLKFIRGPSDGLMLPSVGSLFGRDAAEFNAATFTGDARFTGVTFAGSASFNGATFTRGASFASATFSSTAFFNGATFKGDAAFANAIFTSPGEFGNAIFTGDVEFVAATFTGPVRFKGWCDLRASG